MLKYKKLLRFSTLLNFITTVPNTLAAVSALTSQLRNDR